MLPVDGFVHGAHVVSRDFSAEDDLSGDFFGSDNGVVRPGWGAGDTQRMGQC